MFKISKTFDFCYGHRVHNQTLKKTYSIDDACVCRHLHGHQAKVEVVLEAKELDNGMVTDFKHLNWFKKFLDDNLDHKFIVDSNDPNIDLIVPPPARILFKFKLGLQEKEEICGHGGDSWKTEGIKVMGIPRPEFGRIIHPDVESIILSDAPEIWEILSSFVLVDFVPTSENLSRWLHKIVSAEMNKIGITVREVQFNETPKSQAIYIGI